jgi:hypothetical protein
MRDMLRIVVLGMMGRCPFGGQTWLYLNWLRGLERLGHEVWYVEDDTVWPYDPERDSITGDPRAAVRHIERSLAGARLAGRWAYRAAYRGGDCYGIDARSLDELYATCDALLNLCGATFLREEHLRARFRAYIQTDPVTAELQLANGDAKTRAFLDAHHAVVTYGENYGAPDCGVPLFPGVRYTKTRQPIDLDLWPAAIDEGAAMFTTIGNFRQSGNDVVWRGETYRWSKHHEWEKFMDLPRRTRQPFELAVNACPEDRARLEAAGWRVVEPLRMSLDIFGAYPAYFRRSRGEFTVAKDQNVRLRSGWFSERDACYLASGKPVVAQDTGFGAAIPTGEGLFAVGDVGEAAAAVEAINADYRRHAEAARRIAADFFEARAVAGRMLADLGLA